MSIMQTGVVGDLIDERIRPAFVPCGACQGEGRIITQGRHVWEEIDHGWCPECYGECVVEVAGHEVAEHEVAGHEITQEDIDAAFGDWVNSGRGA